MPAQPARTSDRYVDHLSAQQLARVEALHVARGVLQSTGFMSSSAGAAPDGLIDVAEYIVNGVTQTFRDAIANANADDDPTDDDPFGL